MRLILLYNIIIFIKLQVNNTCYIRLYAQIFKTPFIIKFKKISVRIMTLFIPRCDMQSKTLWSRCLVRHMLRRLKKKSTVFHFLSGWCYRHHSLVKNTNGITVSYLHILYLLWKCHSRIIIENEDENRHAGCSLSITS